MASDPNLRSPYTVQWNAAVEQALGEKQSLSLNYVASAGRRLPIQRVYEPQNVGNAAFSGGYGIYLTTNGATSNYNALQVSFQRKLSQGLQALLSYTWSHAIDDDSSNFYVYEQLRADSDYDIRNNFQAAVTYDVPYRVENRFAGTILNHWATDVRVSARSSTPLDVIGAQGIDLKTGAEATFHPNRIPGVPLYGLEGRLADLHSRVHRGAYRALPSRRVYIEKGDGRKRPLGIAALEDKIVQHAVVTILNNIYEEDFLGFSYGFRPGRSQHKALDALSYALVKRKVNYVLDADIQGFFDNLDKAWMIKFVEHCVADRRILRLIQKWLKAEVMEDGKWPDTETGTPQGSVISPLLANIYLHYVFDLWVDVWHKKCAQGEVIVLRYADDIVLGFQWGADADRFRQQLGERLRKFGLELHPEKTRRIEFGRYAEQNRKQRGEGKPETFDFLGFTHISGKNGNGSYAVRRMTIRKRMRKKLQEIKQQLKTRMHDPVPQTGAWLRSVVQGYLNYYAVPGNLDSLGLFRERVLRYWGQALKRRSQRLRYAWVRRLKLAAKWLPTPRVLHPWPLDRLAATHPR